MLQQANAQAAEKLKAQLSSNDLMPEASIRTEISAERYDHNIGDVAETLSGTMEVKATGLAFNNNDFNKLIQALWSQDIPREHVVLGDINISPPEVISSEGRHMRLRVQASGAIQPVIDADVIVSAVSKPLTEGQAACRNNRRVPATARDNHVARLGIKSDPRSGSYCTQTGNRIPVVSLVG